MDGRNVNRRIIGLPDKGCFAWFACRPGFTKMKDEGGERRWKVAEARIGDEHGFEKHREGMALLCEASKAISRGIEPEVWRRTFPELNPTD